MRKLTLEQFNQLVSEAHIKPRLQRELRFGPSTSQLHEDDWAATELLAITDRNGNRGVLLLAPDAQLVLLPFEITRGLTKAQTGAAQPIICDFCRTWQTGGSAASISFQKDPKSLHSVSFLCCADLACSQHVRGKTTASQASKTQLRETMTNEQRIVRLQNRLRDIIATVHPKDTY